MGSARALYRRLGVVAFRVYPRRRRSGLYVTVRVFRSRAEMRRACNVEERAHGLPHVTRTTQGLMRSYKRVLPSGRTANELGSVNLHRGRLGVAVVVHEFAHAAFAWADRKRFWCATGIPGPMQLEERYCHALDEMVRQFIVRAYALGLYEER